MTAQSRILLTIITEVVLEDIIIDDFKQLGVAGYTISDARGLGTHGRRTGTWRKEGNIRIDVVADSEQCARIVSRFKDAYDCDYGLLMYSHPVDLHA
jgi:hypothetical protein